MTAGPNAGGAFHGLLTDGAGLIAHVHMRVRRSADLLACGNDGHGVKKVARGIKGCCRNGDGQRHIGDGAGSHVFAKERECKCGISLMGCNHVSPMLPIQKADHAIELAVRIIELGQDVQNVSLVVH